MKSKRARQSEPLHTDFQKLEQWQKLQNQTITRQDLNDYALGKRPDLDVLAEPMGLVPISIADGMAADAMSRKRV
jgi:hypothetical protein